MTEYKNYSLETMVNGWTRIDMLLALYDRAIAAIEFAKLAKQSDDTGLMTNQLIEANKFLLGLHSGLDTENDQVAVDVARLLNFVMLRLEEQNFDEAIHFLSKLQSTFEQIRDEASSLEKAGKIPPLAQNHGLNTVA